MLTQTALQSAFEDLRDLSSRTDGGFVGSGNTGEFDEMLTDKLVPTDTADESTDAVISEAVECYLTALEQAPANNTTISKSSPLNDYLNGFNALSGLLVRFWKKKELVDIEKSSAKDQDENDGSHRPAPQKMNSGNSAAGKLSELSLKKKKSSV